MRYIAAGIYLKLSDRRFVSAAAIGDNEYARHDLR